MSAFVNVLRARRDAVQVGDVAAAGAMTVRVQVAEAWDVVRVVAGPAATVGEVKRAALEAILPHVDFAEDYVTKLGGFEVLDEYATLADAGARDGSTFLVARRRRSPIR